MFYIVGTQVLWDILWVYCPFFLTYSKVVVVQWEWIIQLHPSMD